MKRIVIPLLIITLFALGFANVPSAYAGISAPEAYCVSGAGSNAANGTYIYTGEHNGRPYYSLTTGTMYLYFVDFGGFTPWKIDPHFIDNDPPLYDADMDSSFPPTGVYRVIDGNPPGANVSIGACKIEANTGKTFDVFSGDLNDAWVHNSGVFIPTPWTNGVLHLKNTTSVPTHSEFKVLKAYDVKILNNEGNELDNYFGLLYLYFNLSETQVEQLMDGDIAIMRYEKGAGWSGMNTFFAPFEEIGRAATLISQPGIYARFCNNLSVNSVKTH